MTKNVVKPCLWNSCINPSRSPYNVKASVLGIGVAYGLNVMADVQADFTANTAEYNATADAITGISKIPEKLPLIATVVVAAIIIGILVRYLFNQFVRG